MLEGSLRLDSNSDETAASMMDGEVVLINLATGVYYSTDNVGGLIWQLTDLGFSVSETVETIVQRYGVPQDRAREDVHTFLEGMIKERLFVPGVSPKARGAYEPEASGEVPSYSSPVLNVYRDMGDLLALDPPMPGMEDIPWKREDGEG